MPFWFLLIGLLLLVSLCLPWAHGLTLRRLNREIEILQAQIRALSQQLPGNASQKPAPVTAPIKAAPLVADQTEEMDFSIFEGRPEFSSRNQVFDEPDLQSAEDNRQDFYETVRHSGFEQNFGARLPVWVGSIALIFAAFYLIKYSIEAGWLGPVARLTISSLFGVSLLAAGQWIFKRPSIANAQRIAQGLVGSGLVILYGCLYASTNLYDLLPSLVAFMGMAGVTLAAILLSLRHGQPIAAFGIIGGLLTPFLIQTDTPNAIGLFSYLFMMMAGMQIVLARRAWWGLSIVMIVGLLGWAALWSLGPFGGSSHFIVVFFITACVVTMLCFTARPTMQIPEKSGTQFSSVHLLNLATLGGAAALLILFNIQSILTLLDWTLFIVLSLGLMVLQYFKPQLYSNALCLKLALTLAVFYTWFDDASTRDLLTVITMIAACYIALPVWLMGHSRDPRLWAGLQCAAGLSLYLISYFSIKDGSVAATLPSSFWGMTALGLAALALCQTLRISRHYFSDEDIKEHLLAIYALTITAFISLGFAIELPFSYLPIALAGQIAATIWIYQRSHIEALKAAIIILTLIFVGLNYQQIWLFGILLFESLLNPGRIITLSSQLVTNAPLITIGIPALFMSLAAWLSARTQEDRLTQLLSAITILLASCLGYYLIRGFYGVQDSTLTQPASFIERATITLFMAGIGMAFLKASWRESLAFLYPWGVILFHIAMARIAVYDLILLNPYWSGTQAVGSIPIFNGVTLTYGTGAFLAFWAASVREWGDYQTQTRNLYKILGFALLFAFTSLTIRQYFHGTTLAQGLMSEGEFYAYSFAWLVTGLILLAFGIIRDSKTARLASLGFILLTVGKVFLLDAAELDGLYRVASFLGLGLSLIGLSYFYTRFVFKAGSQKA